METGGLHFEVGLFQREERREKRERGNEGKRTHGGGERGFAAPLHCEFPLVSASIMQSSKKRRKRREEIKGKKREKKKDFGL